ncbi:MAG: hypothetical protein COA71_01515 [SAR86 cluster bacterium]|uniref:DUF2750 domain-containing protein n=1 Tax=SAR86 cluster bacterium TaxID=2030880 RepID=A0A2A5CI68_9GAMM|nr:MAG: hypothetical protein COA71_01515 [SAR86 cluster bacterium]
MTTLEEQEALAAFAANISSGAEVWGLKAEQGWALCPSIEFEETEVLPFFSNKEDATLLCSGDWEAYQPEAIPLESFLEDWLPGMHEDSAMIGLNWNADLEGIEVEPADLAAAIDATAQSAA